MNTQDQINQLNSMVKVRIAPSKVHGVGVFAIRDTAKGQKLYADHMPVLFTVSYADMNKLFTEVKDLLLERFPQIVNGSRFIYPTERLQAYINHSEEPNYNATMDETLKDIKAGAEVFENYREIPGAEKVFTWLK